MNGSELRDQLALTLALLGIAIVIADLFRGSRGDWLVLGPVPSLRTQTPFDRQRVEPIAEARRLVEHSERRSAMLAGLVFIALAASTWKAWIDPPLAYALSLLTVAIAQWFEYTRLRFSYSPRVASLTVRPSWSLPPWILGLALLDGAVPLVYVIYPRDALAAVLCSLSAWLMVSLGYAIASLPPLLFGDDPEIELELDRRVRVLRAGGLLAFAAATVNFAALWMAAPEGVAYFWSTMGVTSVTVGACAIWFGKNRKGLTFER